MSIRIALHKLYSLTSLILTAALALLALPSGVQASITWNLGSGGNWDISTANWTGDGGATTTNFVDDGTVDVLFTNNAGGTITISPNMSPLSTTVSAASGTYIFTNGPIDSGTLTKSGAGTLTLSSSNSISGVTLNAGTVSVRNNYGIGTNTLTINGGTFDVLNVTLPSIPIVVNNSCTFFCASANNFSSGTGPVTLNTNATVTLSLGQSPNLANAINNNGYTLTLINTQDGGTTISGKITGSGGLTLRNDLTGNSKTLTINNSTSDFTGPTVLQSSTAANLAIVTPNLSNAGAAGSLGKPTGANAVIQVNNGVVWQPGGTTDRGVNLASSGAGTVQLTVLNASGNATLNGPITATGTGAKTLYVNLPWNNPVSLTIGAISDVSDGSPLSLNFFPGYTDGGNFATLNLNGVNTFTGPITYLPQVGTPNKFNSAINITGAGQLGSGNYANTINLSSTTWARFTYNSSANQILSGVISGAGQLIMSGAGALTLSAANTFFGSTTVNSGKTLTLNNNLALQNSTLDTANGSIVLNSGITTPTIGGLNGSRNLATMITNGYGNVTALTLNMLPGVSATYSGVIT
ncbi:MAG: autotransporter-associated beta strand repeat-containing protein, partial [bacterium]